MKNRTNNDPEDVGKNIKEADSRHWLTMQHPDNKVQAANKK